jgi:uncharacterized protein (TIGR03435 family)
MKAILAIAFSACTLFGQSGAPLAFEVASIKPSPPQGMNSMRVGMSADAGRITYTAVNLRDLMTRAYEVKAPQINGPSWIDSDRFDITAKFPEGATTEQVPIMLRTLLEERFQLKMHRENKEMPIYELIVGKGGIKMEKSKEETGRARMGMEGHGDGVMNATVSSATMANFADMLARWVDRPVIDKTELQGRYDFTLELSMQDLAGAKGGMVVIHGGPAAGSNGPAPDSAPTGSLFTSVQKLGLKLEAKKAPLDLLFIDKAERVPTEN